MWDLVDGFMQYDSMAVLAAIPGLRDTYFAPTTFKGPKEQSLQASTPPTLTPTPPLP